MKTFVKVSSTLFILLFCSGCILTHSVTLIGVRQETLQTKNILIATNGAIALECEAVYVKPADYPRKRPVVEISRSKKFLVASPDVVVWTITNAIAANQSKAKSRKTNRPVQVIQDASTNMVKVTQLVYASTNPMCWKVIPASFGGRDANLKDLPVEFVGTNVTNMASKKTKGAIPYIINGQPIEVQLPGYLYNTNRDSMTWWGYPAQVLLIPAFAVDVIASPYEFILFTRALGNMLN